MNEKDYLEKILSLCSERQKSLFSRMYPGGPKPNQINRAIDQIEKTLKDSNVKNCNLLEVHKKQILEITTLTARVSYLRDGLQKTEYELKEALDLIERLKTPINVENNIIQERLNLLSALEAGGVDNWEFYDESVRNHENT